MKKLLLFMGLCCVLAVSCAAGKNDFGWYTDFKAAKKSAQSQKKNILLFASSFQDFEGSQAAVHMLTKSCAFTDAVKKSYICVHVDFAEADVLSEINDEIVADDGKRSFALKRKNRQKQFAVADAYALFQTPLAIITTAEGYYVDKVDFNYGLADIAAYTDVLDVQKDTVRIVNERVQAIRRSSGVKKVQAIDELYTNTPHNVRAPLIHLVRLIPRIDKKDASGLVSAYLREGAYLEACERLKTSTPDDAAAIYEKNALNKRLTPHDRQLLYYAAAHILVLNGSTSAERSIALFRAAYAADPESPYAKKIALTADTAERLFHAPPKTEYASDRHTLPPHTLDVERSGSKTHSESVSSVPPMH